MDVIRNGQINSFQREKLSGYKHQVAEINKQWKPAASRQVKWGDIVSYRRLTWFGHLIRLPESLPIHWDSYNETTTCEKTSYLSITFHNWLNNYPITKPSTYKVFKWGNPTSKFNSYYIKLSQSNHIPCHNANSSHLFIKFLQLISLALCQFHMWLTISHCHRLIKSSDP